MEEIDAILIPPEEIMGEAMLALNERQRRFVCAALVFDCNLPAAYKFAGYEVTTPGAAQACSSRLHNQPNIQAAFVEENNRRLHVQGSVIAVKRLIEKASLGNVPAINSILDRTGYHAKTEQIVHVSDERTAKDILEGVRQLLSSNSLKPLALDKPIDTEFSEVRDPNDLSDIL